VISNMLEQHVAISPAWITPMAYEEFAGTTVHRSVAPAEVRRQGTSLPIAATAIEGTGLPTAGFQGSGVAQIHLAKAVVGVDRDRFGVVPGVPPRGAPV